MQQKHFKVIFFKLTHTVLITKYWHKLFQVITKIYCKGILYSKNFNQFRNYIHFRQIHIEYKYNLDL